MALPFSRLEELCLGHDQADVANLGRAEPKGQEEHIDPSAPPRAHLLNYRSFLHGFRAFNDIEIHYINYCSAKISAVKFSDTSRQAW